MDLAPAGVEGPATAGPVRLATDLDTAMRPAMDTTARARGFRHLSPSGYHRRRAGADHTDPIGEKGRRERGRTGARIVGAVIVGASAAGSELTWSHDAQAG
jgi:hypothetical protein